VNLRGAAAARRSVGVGSGRRAATNARSSRGQRTGHPPPAGAGPSLCSLVLHCPIATPSAWPRPRSIRSCLIAPNGSSSSLPNGPSRYIGSTCVESVFRRGNGLARRPLPYMHRQRCGCFSFLVSTGGVRTGAHPSAARAGTRRHPRGHLDCERRRACSGRFVTRSVVNGGGRARAGAVPNRHGSAGLTAGGCLSALLRATRPSNPRGRSLRDRPQTEPCAVLLCAGSALAESPRTALERPGLNRGTGADLPRGLAFARPYAQRGARQGFGGFDFESVSRPPRLPLSPTVGQLQTPQPNSDCTATGRAMTMLCSRAHARGAHTPEAAPRPLRTRARAIVGTRAAARRSGCRPAAHATIPSGQKHTYQSPNQLVNGQTLTRSRAAAERRPNNPSPGRKSKFLACCLRECQPGGRARQGPRA
jgi:hypothetical protein